jgi:hypothetical protein
MRTYRLVLALLLAVFGDATGQTSLWKSTNVPGTPNVTSDSASVTLGLRFTSDVAGTVTAVRFYKGTNNTGTHIGTLWSATGTTLGQVQFSGETNSGWQQANFATPIPIAANTTYVVSYLAPNGNYAEDDNYSWSAINAAPLHVSGSSPGVFAYGSGPTFPTSTWNASSYWVDLVFVPATPSTQAISVFSSAAVPGTPSASDASSVELGLKFSSDVSGSVTAVRFYKGSSNTGTHVGNLWTGTGTKLSSVTFTNETASGWQQANFPAPVPIAANTTYVISYLASRGYYANDQNYSWSAVNATPLHVSGSAPGVFAYGSTSTFPAGSWNSSNYWVDLVFSSASQSGPGTYSISGQVTGSAATLSLSGAASASSTTDAAGTYTFSGLKNGSYVIAPIQPGYSFTPSTASASVNGANVTGINFAATASPHSVTLSWTASTSPNITGYNVYCTNSSGGPWAKLNASLVGGTGYVHTSVVSGQTYYYVVTAVDSSNSESGYSTQASAQIPTP